MENRDNDLIEETEVVEVGNTRTALAAVPAQLDATPAKPADFRKLFGTDKEAEKGKWVHFLAGISFLIARAGGKEFTASSRKHFRPYRSLLAAKKDLPFEDSIRVTSSIIVDSILLDWRGVVIDGVEVPYSKGKAFELLIEYRDFRDWIWEQSSAAETFKAEDLYEAGKD